MLQINVRVPENREHAAIVQFGAGFLSQVAGFAAASASAEIAAKHGNATCDPLRPWGHPAPGVYQLIAYGPAPKGCENEYGKYLLAFQPMSGAALDAESYGRLTLLAYSGPPDGKRRLRRTQGGLRFDPQFMKLIAKRLDGEPEVVLRIHAVRKPAWWQFWVGALPAIPLSPESPRFQAPPLDEASLAEALSAGKRRARPVPMQTDDRDWNDRDRSSSSTSSSSSDNSYSGGRGGEYGGAGASGSWDKAAHSGSGAGRGVDASGRIATVAAVAATAAALHAAAHSGDGKEGNEGSAGGDASGGVEPSSGGGTNY
jgi:uncharacterized membrane protein YgcG